MTDANGRSHDGLDHPDAIGLVLGTHDATPLEFWIGVSEERAVQLDDMVSIRSRLPGSDDAVTFYGVVDVVRKRLEGTQFDSDAFRVAQGLLPVDVSYAAHVQITRVEPEVFVPPHPGDVVRIVRGRAFEEALYFDRMEKKIPVGLTRADEPVFANVEFVDGTRGAHASISGISGVATKTSYATFLLYSLFHSEAFADRALNTKALIFNVKGEDLLWLDKENARVDESDRQAYSKLGLDVGPFRSVGFFAPIRPGQGAPVPSTGSRQKGVRPFVWSMREFCAERLLRFAFTDSEDANSQYAFVVDQVETALYRAATKKGAPKSGVLLPGLDDPIHSLDDLVDALDGEQLNQLVPKSFGEATLNAFRRRLSKAAKHIGHMVRDDFGSDYNIDWQAQQVTVVDLHALRGTAQMFVVGVVLKRLLDEKEAQGKKDPQVFVVLDELNKYAPRNGWSPIQDVLLDIAERGRSLGVSLLGAQQTASEVERRVVGNAALKIVGRLDAAEAERSEYGFLTPSARMRAKMIQPGTMIIAQPEIPTPLLVRFPFPSWATRQSEVKEAGAEQDDPFSARFD